jgi:hypothetical protein
VTQELLVARLREQLRGGRSAKTSEPELRQDWKLLKTAFSDDSESAVTHRKAAGERDALESTALPASSRD